MSDKIHTSFLRAQREQALALAAASDLLELTPGPGDAPSRYVARFKCDGLVRMPAGEIARANRFDVGIQFPESYLRHVEPLQVATMLWPHNVWAPNVNGFGICVGHLPPGTTLVEILYQLFDIIAWNRFRLDDALNPDACEFARNNMGMFPIDRRPLKRRAGGGPK